VKLRQQFKVCPNCLGELKYHEKPEWMLRPDLVAQFGPPTDYDCYRCGRSWYIQVDGDWKDGAGITYPKAVVESWQHQKPKSQRKVAEK